MQTPRVGMIRTGVCRRWLCGLAGLLVFFGTPEVDLRRSAGAIPVRVGVVSVWAQNVPLENRLSAGTTGLLRTLAKRFRQLRKVIVNASVRWKSWLGGAAVFVVLSVLTPVLDRALLEIWRREGGRAFGGALWGAIVVYVRLLFDSRTPGLGKGLIAFAVVYGAASADLMPDRGGLIWGFADDILVIVLASRSFMRMCPDDVVIEHASRLQEQRAARRR